MNRDEMRWDITRAFSGYKKMWPWKISDFHHQVDLTGCCEIMLMDVRNIHIFFPDDFEDVGIIFKVSTPRQNLFFTKKWMEFGILISTTHAPLAVPPTTIAVHHQHVIFETVHSTGVLGVHILRSSYPYEPPEKTRCSAILVRHLMLPGSMPVESTSLVFGPWTNRTPFWTAGWHSNRCKKDSFRFAMPPAYFWWFPDISRKALIRDFTGFFHGFSPLQFLYKAIWASN